LYLEPRDKSEYAAMLEDSVEALTLAKSGEEFQKEILNIFNKLQKLELEDIANYIENTKSKKFYLDLINAARELEYYHIKFNDYHEGNILKDANGNYKLIDLGVSKSPETKIDQLEHKTLKLRNII